MPMWHWFKSKMAAAHGLCPTQCDCLFSGTDTDSIVQLLKVQCIPVKVVSNSKLCSVLNIVYGNFLL